MIKPISNEKATTTSVITPSPCTSQSQLAVGSGSSGFFSKSTLHIARSNLPYRSYPTPYVVFGMSHVRPSISAASGRRLGGVYGTHRLVREVRGNSSEAVDVTVTCAEVVDDEGGGGVSDRDIILILIGGLTLRLSNYNGLLLRGWRYATQRYSSYYDDMLLFGN